MFPLQVFINFAKLQTDLQEDEIQLGQEASNLPGSQAGPQTQVPALFQSNNLGDYYSKCPVTLSICQGGQHVVVDIILGICGIHKVMYMQYLGFFFFFFFFF